MKFHDFEETAQKVLDMAQFGFPMKPISVNAAYVPTVNHATKRADVRLSADATNYKNMIQTLLPQQKRRNEWECLNREFSMWIIVDRKQRIDIDNCHKLIQDAFVSSGVIPDDRYAVDTRQMYADFSKSQWANTQCKFAVLIRWGKELTK